MTTVNYLSRTKWSLGPKYAKTCILVRNPDDSFMKANIIDMQ